MNEHSSPVPLNRTLALDDDLQRTVRRDDPAHLTAGSLAPPPRIELHQQFTVALQPGEPAPAANGIAAPPPPSPREPYLLRQVVGKGGQGEVWEAVQTSLSRSVAVKRLKSSPGGSTPSGLSSPSTRTLFFLREAFITAQLDHPNIVPVYDLGTTPGDGPMMSMKLVRGTVWEDLLKRDFKSLPADEFLNRHLPILIQVCHAIAFAHSRGVAHRDLKPAQVIVGHYGEVLLMDWGLAFVFDEQRLFPGGAPAGTQRDIIPVRDNAPNPAGTVGYMAPEQTDDHTRRLGPWTDLYLLGGILYRLLTGALPHQARNADLGFVMAEKGEFRPLAEAAPAGRFIPPELEALVLDAMAVEPHDRLPGAERMIEAVQNYLSGAGRVNRSQAITQEVTGQWEAGRDDYASLAASDNQLDEALTLWPDNAPARQLRERVIAAHAQLALRNGDLLLARFHAERLPAEHADKAAMLAEIAKLERRAKIRAYQRCAFIRVSIFLIVGIFAVTMYFYRRNVQLSEQNEHLVEQLWDARGGAGPAAPGAR